MQRILSFPQMSRNIGESSEYVTKRLCFSFLFSVGFLCLLCGFLLGRFTVERLLEAQVQKIRGELAGNGLWNTEHLQQLVLLELESAPFNYDRMADRQTPDDVQRISGLFSNLSFVDIASNHASYVRGTIRGSQEPDRYIILSAKEDGITVALELAQILNAWQPRRSLIFCVSLTSSDVCPQALPKFMRQKIVAYLAVHGRFARANGRVALSGSDIMRFVAVEGIKTIPGNTNWEYLEQEVFGPRLPVDVPQVIFSFNDDGPAHSQMQHNQNSHVHNVILAQVVSQTIWRLSESIIIQWEPRYFNKTVNEMLKSIDTSRFQDAKEKLKKTLKILLETVKDSNIKLDVADNTQILSIRIWNDLLLDLDKALLCPDEIDLHSKTDLAILHKLLHESISESIILTYLDQMTKCYEDAIQVLKER